MNIPDDDGDEAARMLFYTAPASPSELADGRVRTWSDLTEKERDHWRDLARPAALHSWRAASQALHASGDDEPYTESPPASQEVTE